MKQIVGISSALRAFVKKRRLLHRIAVSSRDTLRYKWYQRMGLGYVKDRIVAGPNQGLVFYAARRVRYSRDFWTGEYELALCRFLETVVQEDAVCYDIGANLGYHTLIMARRASRGHVFAFEPLPEAAGILGRNIRENQIGNVALVDKAVFNKSGLITLGRDLSIDQAAVRWAADDECIHRPFTCEAVRVDDFVSAGNAAPTLVKIDVEGAETEVLSGAVETLARFHPLVVCETHGVHAAGNVFWILREAGYSLFNVAGRLSPIDSFAGMPKNMYEGHVFATPQPSAFTPA